MAGRRNIAKTKPNAKKKIVPKSEVSSAMPEPEVSSAIPEPELESEPEISSVAIDTNPVADSIAELSPSLPILTFDDACKSLNLFSGQIRTHYEFDTYFIIDLYDGMRHKIFKT